MTHDIFKYDDSGRLHSEVGPAIIYANVDQEWYYHGNNVTYDVYTWAISNNISLYNLSADHKTTIKDIILNAVKYA